MDIETKYHGKLSIAVKDRIVFNQGIPGFPDEKAFVFLPLQEGAPYVIMQSLQTPALAFVTVSPFVFFQDYEFEISDQVAEQLQFTSETDATVYVILALKEPFEASTANLVAPVLVNHHKQVGKQVVLEKSPYGTKHHPFLNDIQKREGDHHARPHSENK
ncbi:flagellar assembly protein FliW [Camelliibacillus cellulosilyticus]|uniref:Flagellar assembly factor FliW n=1 Tax=Camelliibacillus cellulosilyticus TaxID=2174486 RepID=A0ABV9GPH6_9BACL